MYGDAIGLNSVQLYSAWYAIGLDGVQLFGGAIVVTV